MAVYETDEIIEKVILVGVAFDTYDELLAAIKKAL